jgi:hypothetical protein
MADPVYISRIYRSVKGGLRIERKSRIKGSVPNNGNIQVSEFSERSRQNLAWVCSQSNPAMVSMITLTYQKSPNNGKDAKYDLKVFLNSVRRNLPDVKYIWFMEFQRRGAIHYHVLLSERVQPTVYSRLSAIWSKIAIGRGGNSRHIKWFNSRRRDKFWQDEKKVGGLARYGLKYALKLDQKICPQKISNCGRYWGCSRGLVKETVLIQDYKGLLPDGIMSAIADDYAHQRNPKITQTSGLTYIY